jgi:hypothetical protein
MSKSSLKFKAGDTVCIIDDTTFHGFEIGSFITIESIKDWDNGFFSYEAIDKDGDCMLFDDDDCSAIQGVLQ